MVRRLGWERLGVGALMGMVALTTSCTPGHEKAESTTHVRLAAQTRSGTLTWSLPTYADPLVVPTFSASTGTVTITPGAPWNQTAPPGTTNPQIGFCATRANPSANTLPVVIGTTPTF